MSAVTAALDQEITELEADLEINPDPRVQRLEQLKEVRRTYLASVPALVSIIVHTAPEPDRHGDQYPLIHGAILPPQRPAGRRPSPERQRAVTAAREFLATMSEPVRTVAIYNALRARGINIGGNDPINNLSAMLSNASEFRSQGRLGWVLERQQEAAG